MYRHRLRLVLPDVMGGIADASGSNVPNSDPPRRPGTATSGLPDALHASAPHASAPHASDPHASDPPICPGPLDQTFDFNHIIPNNNNGDINSKIDGLSGAFKILVQTMHKRDQDLHNYMNSHHPYFITRGRAEPLHRSAARFCQDNRQCGSREEDKTLLYSQVRDLQQKLLGIKIDRDIIKVYADHRAKGTLVTEEQQAAFANSDENAREPQFFPLQIYWPHPRAPWNLYQAAFFTEVFLQQYPQRAAFKAEIEEHFLARLKTLKNLIDPAMAMSSDPAGAERVGAALNLRKSKMARMNERRFQLYSSRRDIANELRQDKSLPTPEVDAWKALFWMVESMGAQGTSSDESESEPDITGHRVYPARLREWRSDEVLDLLMYIDENKKRFGPLGGPLPGNPARKRPRRATANVSERKAIAGLPINFYRQVWYDGLSANEKQLLNPQSEFRLPHFN